MWLLDFRGEFAALGAAFLWAIASVVYSRLGTTIAPPVLNLSKGMIAIVLICITLVGQGNWQPSLANNSLVFLLLSGAVGIGLGDTFYFAALNCIGPRRTLLLQTLAPSLTALLALFFLRETLSPSNWLGIILTTLGVTWVISERAPNLASQTLRLGHGITFSLLAALAEAGGAVLSRAALATTTIDPLWSALVRLLAGVTVLFLWLPIRGELHHCWVSVKSWRFLYVIGITAFFSTYLGIWLQQISLKFSAAGVAQALSATSPLFVLPLAVWMGDHLSVRSVLGVLMTLGGVWLLFD